MKHNEFDSEEKYKLYRKVCDLLHPTISKRNISNYRIIFDDKYLPLRVFYPKKVTNMQDIMIYIHGEGTITNCDKNYSQISSNFAKKFGQLVISIDYDNCSNITLKELSIKIYDTIKKIYFELIDAGICSDNITLVGDSTAATIILNFVKKFNMEKIVFGKFILFYPPVSGMYANNRLDTSYDLSLFPKLKKYYKNIRKTNFPMNNTLEKYPNTLILCGNIDPLVDEVREFSKLSKKIKLKEICFASHGFLNSTDKEIVSEYDDEIVKFLKNKNR